MSTTRSDAQGTPAWIFGIFVTAAIGLNAWALKEIVDLKVSVAELSVKIELVKTEAATAAKAAAAAVLSRTKK
jgi:hypothetical protein